MTFRANYADYLLYRGWISSESFTKAWWNDPQYHAKNRAAMTKIPAAIDNPQVVVTEPNNCIDSGAWYITSLRPKALGEIDTDSFNIAETSSENNAERELIKKVTRGINGGDNNLNDRVKYTKMIKDILL